MKKYAIYNLTTYKASEVTYSRREAEELCKPNGWLFYREYRYVTKKQILALPYAKAVDFEQTLKECH